MQLGALSNLYQAGVRCHPAVMLSFSPKDSLRELSKKLRAIHPSLENELEEECVFFYPKIAERLKKAGIKPLKAHSPHSVPEKLI